MGFPASILVIVIYLPAILAHKSEKTRLIVETDVTVAETDGNYICATIDWWPHDKCNYNRCPWGSASVINLNISHPFLSNAVQAFKSLRIRIGGSLQDQVVYHVGKSPPYCPQFRRQRGGMFGFSKGCLHMERWDELNHFFNKTGVLLTFSLNALVGRHRTRQGIWQGDWDSSNARDFISYTVLKGYKVDSWEFGNELCGSGVGARVGAEQYGKDMIHLNAVIDEVYKNSQPKPRLLAPGGFYDKWWFNKMLQVSGPHVVDVITHHLYNLGPGNDGNIKNKILNPAYLDKTVTSTFINIASTIQDNGPWTSAWVGESGGAYNSGAQGVSDTFLDSFWYLDQLGMAAKHKTEVYCRQSLIGGFYGLLDRTTFTPNPDYYGALLWHRLMGRGVLAVTSNASPYLRAYAHCAKGRAGVAVLLINLSKKTKYRINLVSSSNTGLSIVDQKGVEKRSFSHVLKRSILWIGDKASTEDLYREEYHLTPEGGNLESKTVLLNGQPLRLTQTGAIPSLVPVLKDIESRVSIAPLSIKFVVHPYIDAPGCK